MALDIASKYPGKSNAATAAYPFGSARNITTPGDGTGTPLEEAWLNDLFGFQQALINGAGLTPSGNADTAQVSQYLEAARIMLGAVAKSVAELEAITASVEGQRAFLSAGGRSGPFNATLSDISTQVAADPLQGVYVAFVSDPTGASGGWVRRIEAGRVTFEMFGATGEGGDDTAAVLGAVASGFTLVGGRGEYGLTQEVIINTTGQFLYGSGADSTKFKALAGFSGTSVITFGNRDTASLVARSGGKDFSVDCNGETIPGVSVYGLRDGSFHENVVVEGCGGSAGWYYNKAGNGSGAASGLMTQGYHALNCHIISDKDQNTAMWKVDGVFESQFFGCKALGYSVSNNVSATGFEIGVKSQCRGVNLYGCSIGNLAGAGGGNLGIQYGEWASDCNDHETTFENIRGSAVLFDGGTGEGKVRPVLCRSVNPRLFNVPEAGILNPAYRFKAANSCQVVDIAYYSSGKVWVEFEDSLNQLNNSVTISGNVNPDALAGSLIIFGAASADSNLVHGFSSADTKRRRFELTKNGRSYHDFANGFSIEADEFWTTFKMSAVDKMRWRDSGNVEQFRVDPTTMGVGGTSLWLRADNGAEYFAQVQIGEPDSGGAGYRALRIVN